MNIVCGKYDAYLDLAYHTDPNRISVGRIFSTHPNKLKTPARIPIATDGRSVFYRNQRLSLDQFAITLNDSDKSNLIALTCKEVALLSAHSTDYNYRVQALENIYPVFGSIQYTGAIKNTYNFLVGLLSKVSKSQIKGRSLAQYLSTKNHYSNERSIRFKSSLDSVFSLGDKRAIQEVYKFYEERDRRKIVALDFNSMYPYCLRGNYPDPKRLIYKRIERNIEGCRNLGPGAFVATFQTPTSEFIRSLNAFSYTLCGWAFRPLLEESDSVTTMVSLDELKFYSRHFAKTVVHEGVYSHEGIGHPLCKKSAHLFDLRRSASVRKGLRSSAFYKYWLVTLHSASSPNRSSNMTFDCYADLREHLRAVHMINLSAYKHPETALGLLMKTGKFSIKRIGDRFILRQPEHENWSTIQCLSFQTAANARVKMMCTMDRLLKFPSLELCYVNVDSIHVSIDSSQLDQFFENHSDLIGNELGQMKIQAVADKGYWFDVGRYWLFKDGKVIKHANHTIGPGESGSELMTQRRGILREKTKHFDAVRTKRASVQNSFSFEKQLLGDTHGHCEYQRFDVHQIVNLTAAYETVCEEVLASKARKVSLMERIKSGM